MVDWDDQMIERCFFVEGVRAPEIYPKHTQVLELGKVDPIVVSETLHDLSVLADKAKT
jgi:hypothetical protein